MTDRAEPSERAGDDEGGPPMLDDDDPFCTAPVHRWAPAAELPAPKVHGPRSVFDLSAASLSPEELRGSARAWAAPKSPRCHVVRLGGTTRCVGSQYPGDRWTAERLAKEAARRARQRPPRPTKKARTKSKKLRELIGSDDAET